MTVCNVPIFKESLIISDISFQCQHQRMGLTKQLGEHMLGSSHSTKGAAGELSDKQALKEALKLAKHKGGLRVCIVGAEQTFTVYRPWQAGPPGDGLCGHQAAGGLPGLADQAQHQEDQVELMEQNMDFLD